MSLIAQRLGGSSPSGPVESAPLHEIQTTKHRLGTFSYTLKSKGIVEGNLQPPETIPKSRAPQLIATHRRAISIKQQAFCTK